MVSFRSKASRPLEIVRLHGPISGPTTEWRTCVLRNCGAIARSAWRTSKIALRSARPHRPWSKGRNLICPFLSLPERAKSACSAGSDTKPAFDVFASLTGSAVETHCSVATQSGFVVEYDGVWLTDYNVDLTLKYREESGTTDVVFRNISIEPNPSFKVRGSSVEDAARNPQRKQRRAAAVDEMPQICFSC